MSVIGTGSSRVIVDVDGEAATVTSGKLDVNAYLNATPTIDIGDVSLLLGGTAADTNNGTAGAQTLRVTIASDTTGVLSIDDNGGSITVDGTVTANLSATDNAVLDDLALELERINTAVHSEDAAASGGERGIQALAVRRDLPSSGVGADGDYASLSVDYTGGLYTRELSNYSIDTFTMIDVDNTEEMLSDTIGVFTNCHEIFLQADESNTGYVMVGDGDVEDNRGMKLSPGDTIILNMHDTRGVYLWGSAANQNVRCMIKTRVVA